MQIKRVYNNNVVMAINEQGEERVALGRGIAFGKRPGDEIDDASVEKVFALEGQENLSRFERLMRDIPSEYLAVSEEIIEMLRRESDLQISDALLIALTDHISLALEREKAGVPCDNPLLMEIRQFYRREFELAQDAARIIEERCGIRVSEGEIGFICLHIVNATMGQRADVLVRSVQLIHEVLNIVAEDFSLTYDEHSIQYERFLRHLQFFAQRVLDDKVMQSDDTFLYAIGKAQYPAALACTERIGAFVQADYGRTVSDAEKGYLLYHIMNLVHATNGESGSKERSTNNEG